MLQFQKETRRLILFLLASFVVVAISAAYWAVNGADSLLLRADNPRLFEQQAAIVRGQIYDRDGELLVNSVQNPTGRVSRDFLHSSFDGALGYYSLQYGVGGAEAAYNTILRGDDLERTLESYVTRDLLHLPRRGTDVRLTFDLEVQRAVVEAMADYQGAAVVLRVPSGEVLAMTSQPSYDPNQLDSLWPELVTDEDDPIFNRALQGEYQPGSLLQTPMLIAAVNAGLPLDQISDGASQTINAGGVDITCAAEPPADRLTLGEAYAFGCPAYFAELYRSLGPQSIGSVIAMFRFDEGYTLPGFVAPPVADAVTATLAAPEDTTPEPTLTPVPNPTDLTLADVLGQGDITLSPLDVAVMTAAVVNNGNAPLPYALLATRPPDAETWTPHTPTQTSNPITTSDTMLRLQAQMRNATITGGARDAARSDINVGGQVAVAYAGESVHTWFTGFVITGPSQGITVALVLEDTNDIREAAIIGGNILEAAYSALLTANETASSDG